MNICFSVTNLQLGGAQMFVTRLAAEFAATSRHQVWIYDHWPEYRQLHIDPSSGVRVVSYCESPAFRWLIWKMNALFRLLGIAKAYRHTLNHRRFFKFLTRRRIRVLNSHALFSDQVISSVALPPSCVFIPTLHGEYELMLDPGQQPEAVAALRRNLSRCPLLIYTAEKNLAVPHRLLGRLPQTERINVGINREKLPTQALARSNYGIADDEFVAGMVSRGIREKNWEAALDAVATANRNRAKKIRLLLVGDGDYVAELVRSRADSNVMLMEQPEGHVEYYRYYSLFDVFLFPSVFAGESMPNAVIEALSWNVPVIATRHAGLPYMIEEGTPNACGFCVEMNQNVAGQISEKLVLLAEDALLRHRLADNCKEAFKKFDLKHVSARYEEVFTRVAEK